MTKGGNVKAEKAENKAEIVAEKAENQQEVYHRNSI
jgi:hypothetical protein